MRSVCPHDCPSCCSLDVRVDNGRITTVTGDRQHAFTQGVICGKVRAYGERVHSPLRIAQPLRRIGPKGHGRFEPVGWQDAVGEIALRWRETIAADGAEAILPFSYAGSMGALQYHAGHALFHALGASQLDRTICVSTAYAGWRATLGAVTGNDSEQMVGADLVVLWGINAAYSTINVMTLVKQARARGAYFVVIDPYRTADRPAGRRAPDGEARQRWRAGPGDDARPGARGSARPRLPRAGHRRLRSARRARRRVDARARRADRRAARGDHHPLRPSLRRDPPRVPAHRHRNLAPRQRRHDVSHAGLSAGADRRLRRSPRRGPALLRQHGRASTTPCSSAPTCCARRRRASST